ncbi:MAG: lactonase family protein [Bryobacterales bacterium]|nr:lactonase family protein [Bryobacteraceae bacterium]MDW8129560.1 lactonase family protein [Bryobacterales bacterium]
MGRIVLLGLLVAPACLAGPHRFLAYFGTYTGGKSSSKGIYVAFFDAAGGALGNPELAAEAVNPSFLAVHPNGRLLYAVGETGGPQGGTISAFAIEQPGGRLKLLNQVSSRGRGPCHITVDAKGRHVLVVNYSSGSTAVVALREDGSLGESTAFIQHQGSSVNPRRQEGPHAHSVNLSPDNRYALVADLGLDQVLVYRFDTSRGTLEPNEPPFARVAPGSGPRHLAFHPSGRLAYVINELASTITAFSWDGRRGLLTEIQTVSTLPEGFSGENYTAEVVVHPNGRFLYGSNRGHDSIAAFAIAADGKLSPIGWTPTQGSFPRNFALDPTGRWLFAANQRSDSVVLFRVDTKTGKLEPTGRTLRIAAPVCVRFAPAN